ncbi:MAG: hypothetical protein RLZZ490_1470 [Cyanobacteriota bacterium]|jgi:hypothetical protein
MRVSIPLTGDLAIIQGETYQALTLIFPGDLTTWTPRGQIRTGLLEDAGTLLAEFAFGTPAYDADADTTNIYPTLTASQTANLPKTKWQGTGEYSRSGVYYYDIELESEGVVIKSKTAIVQVVGEVTGGVDVPPVIPPGNVFLISSNNLSDIDDVEEARANLGIVGGVKPDWTATPGDSSEILNQPTLGTAAAANVEDFATTAQGELAESALQPEALSDYVTESELTTALSGKQDSGDYLVADDLPDLSEYVTESELTTALSGKQDSGDYLVAEDLPDLSGYVTESELTTALGGKQDSGDYLIEDDLSDYETSTQLNARDAANRDRTNHTGTQAIDTIDGLETALSGKENADPTILKDADIGVTIQPYNSNLIPLDALTDKALYYYDATSGLMLPIGVGTENQALIAKPALNPPYQWATPSGGGRELLTADRTYYVRTDGNDSNDGLSDTPGGAFRNPQKAVDKMASLDLGIYNATALVRDGTYDGKIRLKSYVGSGKCYLRGNPNNVSGVVFDYTTSTGSIDAVIDSDGVLTPWYIGDFSIAATATNRFSIRAWNGASIVIDKPILFDSTNGGTHIFLDNYGKCFISSNYIINGATGNHIFARVSSTFIVSANFPITLTLTNASWASYFINAQRLSLVDYWGFTLSGSATGVRYNAAQNSAIYTSGTTLPGSVNGTIASGGVIG